jgi:hypothetical protein
MDQNQSNKTTHNLIDMIENYIVYNNLLSQSNKTF